MYPDVAPALARWHSMGIKTYIYSSGSRCRTLDGQSISHSIGIKTYIYSSGSRCRTRRSTYSILKCVAPGP
jgi:methionine salvage enolase-phosphatase E1